MTPEEFAKEMKNIQEKCDTEDGHIAMDDLMCKVLCQLGYEEGIKIFVNTGKWYS